MKKYMNRFMTFTLQFHGKKCPETGKIELSFKIPSPNQCAKIERLTVTMPHGFLAPDRTLFFIISTEFICKICHKL